jgi:cytochrome o ubiquinol oxidase operon protein cyoD
MSGLYDKDTGTAYGTYKTYIKGFIFSIIITTVAFLLVGFKVLSPLGSCIAIAILALTQLFVQLVYFLYLSTDSEARWNLVSGIFALICLSKDIFN